MLASPRVLGCRILRRYGRKQCDGNFFGFSLSTGTSGYARFASFAKDDQEDLHYSQKSLAQADISSYGCVLRSCGDERMWKDGMLAHHHIIVDGLVHDSFLQGLLVQMYGKCGSLDHALNVFHAMPEHSAFSWNFIIRACAQQGHYQEALELFHQMQQEGAAPDRFTYVCAFTACTGKGDLWCNMQMHARIIDSNLEFDTSVGTAVVHMYGNCGRISDAKHNFERMTENDVVSWNVMLAIYAQHDHMKQASQLFHDMQQQGYFPTYVSFLSMLDACAIRSALSEGKRVHVYILAGGTTIDMMMENALVNMYGKCCLQRARVMFEFEHVHNVVTWTIMIASCARHGEIELAFYFYNQMCQEGVLPDKVTFLEILAACEDSLWLFKGERLVACLIRNADDMVMTEVVNMYGRCDSAKNARKVFDAVSLQSIVAWNTMVSVYAQHGEVDDAFQLFAQLVLKLKNPTSVTFVSILGACSKVFEGRMLHAFIIESSFEADIIMGNAIISMYGRSFNIEDAWSTFTSLAWRDVISWNAIIAAYASDGRVAEAYCFLEQMLQEGIKPDKVTYTTILEGYAHCELPAFGDLLGCLVMDMEWAQDTGSAVTSKLSQPSVMHNAWRLFYEIDGQDVRAWNAMINIYVHQNLEPAAFHLFERMLTEAILPNNDSFISMISACAGESSMIVGKRLHSCITNSELESDFAVGTALVTMYGNLGNVDESRKAFDRFTNKNVVLWTAMISVYAQGWHGGEGLKLFILMQQCGVLPNNVTYINALEACITHGALFEGKNLHACISGGGLLSNVPVITALIDMYSKCGRLDDAWAIFHQAPVQDHLLWNTMISLYSQHGHVSKAVELFESMEKEGLKPDKVTLISILTACSHCGLIEDGFCWLRALLEGCDVLPSSPHYVCMIDIVGRAGQLEIAQALVNGMPFQPTEVPYIMVLRACQQGADLKHGGWAAAHSFELFSGNTAPYVLLSNIHALDSKRLSSEAFFY